MLDIDLTPYIVTDYVRLPNGKSHAATRDTGWLQIMLDGVRLGYVTSTEPDAPISLLKQYSEPLKADIKSAVEARLGGASNVNEPPEQLPEADDDDTDME